VSRATLSTGVGRLGACSTALRVLALKHLTAFVQAVPAWHVPTSLRRGVESGRTSAVYDEMLMLTP
jgi:hypothetical protein